MASVVSSLATDVVIRNDASAAACTQYVGDQPTASAYHRPEWTGLIARAFGHKTAFLSAHRDGRVVGVLPLVFFRNPIFGRFAVSMPFLNYGGVLADSRDVERALVDRAISETAHAGGSHLELRHTRQRFPAMAAKRHKVAMLLDLETSTDRQWERLDRKLRNQVRKAEKSSLDVHIGGIELLNDFYQVFARNMRDLGTPVYGVNFFKEILTTFPDCSRTFVVSVSGRPVAASIVHWHRDTIEVPWASAVREFNPLCVNVLLYWCMLRFAIERGFRTFDFGRSTREAGTFLFKKQWGAEPHELVWEYWMADGRPLPDLNPQNPKFAAGVGVWQRLPLRLATAVGPFIVRNIP